MLLTLTNGKWFLTKNNVIFVILAYSTHSVLPQCCEPFDHPWSLARCGLRPLGESNQPPAKISEISVCA